MDGNTIDGFASVAHDERMSYSPPPPHGGYVHAVPPPPDSSKKFLNLSGGMLALVIAGVIFLFCVAPILCCMAMPILGGILGDPTITPSPSRPF